MDYAKYMLSLQNESGGRCRCISSMIVYICSTTKRISHTFIATRSSCLAYTSHRLYNTIKGGSGTPLNIGAPCVQRIIGINLDTGTQEIKCWQHYVGGEGAFRRPSDQTLSDGQSAPSD